MSTTDTNHDGKKVIQTGVAVLSALIALVMFRFFEQMGVWFDLESKMKNYGVVSQAAAVALGIATFLVLINNQKTAKYMKEVYTEAMKIVYPDKNQTMKHTVGIMIGVGIVGFLLGFFDFVAGYLLSLVR